MALGCQNGCWPASKEDEEKRDREVRDNHNHDVDDDDYMDRMHHYRYDADNEYPGHHHDYYRHRYSGYHHEDEDGYHHRYDDDPDHEAIRGYHDGQHIDGNQAYGDDDNDHVANEAHMPEHAGGAPSSDANEGNEADEQPQLVGLEEKRHLGEGDNVPLATA